MHLFLLQKQKEFVAKKLSDALELVLGGHANPRGTSTSERNTSFSESLQSALSRSLSKNSATLARNLSNSSATLARNLSTPSARHSRHPSAGQKVFEMLPLVDGQEVGVNGEGLDQRERAYSKENVVTRSRRARPAEPIDYALVIDGQSLTFILAEEELQELFLKVCINCASVLCCRVSPRQKAQVTTLVRKGLGQHRLCLAIGDGANDVGMIQAANVGVGILGVEGAQVIINLQCKKTLFDYLFSILAADRLGICSSFHQSALDTARNDVFFSIAIVWYNRPCVPMLKWFFLVAPRRQWQQTLPSGNSDFWSAYSLYMEGGVTDEFLSWYFLSSAPQLVLQSGLGIKFPPLVSERVFNRTC